MNESILLKTDKENPSLITCTHFTNTKVLWVGGQRLSETQARQVADYLNKELGIETLPSHKAKLAAQGRASR